MDLHLTVFAMHEVQLLILNRKKMMTSVSGYFPAANKVLRCSFSRPHFIRHFYVIIFVILMHFINLKNKSLMKQEISTIKP